jgi:DNA-binding XRE family transcriptional regulator
VIVTSPVPAPERKAGRLAASPRQCRAARALLNWTQAHLAKTARVARKTVADLEVGNRPLRYRTRLDITLTFEEHGIEFLWATQATGEGVRLAKPD